MNKFRKITATTLAVFTLLGLSACKETQAQANRSTQKQATEKMEPAALFEEVAKKGKGFTVGQLMSTKTVYVMFDPQCPHCSMLWKEAEPLLKEAKFIWVPVAFLNAKSRLQGAKLLEAPDAVAAMNEHELTLLSKGGIDTKNPDKDALDAVGTNTATFAKSGAASVPFMIIKNAKGKIITHAGGLPTDVLRQVLNGEPVPAQFIR